MGGSKTAASSGFSLRDMLTKQKRPVSIFKPADDEEDLMILLGKREREVD